MVIFTSTPETVAKKVSYAQVLERAQQRINLMQLGITDGLTVRQRLRLNLAHSSEQVEMLAESLRAMEASVTTIKLSL